MKSQIILNNYSFSGYWATGKTYVKGEESSYMYLGVLTDNKVAMSVVAVYENASDLAIINKVTNSIKRKN